MNGVSDERHDPFLGVDYEAADPMVRKLLDHAEALGIDNRGLYRLRHVQMHALGGKESWKAAVLANEEWNGTITLITDEPLLESSRYELWQGHDQPVDGKGRLYRVNLSRPGQRRNDAQHPVFVSYLDLEHL